uniref:Uncharacterized protein n=1 Tax=Sphaerodactylus townsendi TaxID=933632 RepID=A0ACB8FND2_9SAUR
MERQGRSSYTGEAHWAWGHCFCEMGQPLTSLGGGWMRREQFGQNEQRRHELFRFCCLDTLTSLCAPTPGECSSPPPPATARRVFFITTMNVDICKAGLGRGRRHRIEV